MLRKNRKLYINWESTGRNSTHFRNLKVVYVCSIVSNNRYFLASEMLLLSDHHQVAPYQHHAQCHHLLSASI